MASITVEYFGHSCFRLRCGEQRIVLDPYADGSVPGLPPLDLEAEFVYCSHGHGDHSAADRVKLLPHGEPEFTVTELETDHDDAGGSLRGKNTVRVFSFGGLRVAHLGDLGRSLTGPEAEALRGLDLVLIPVGGHFTIDAQTAKEILDTLNPRAAVLMHYRSSVGGYEVIAHIDDILKVLGPAEALGGEFALTEREPRGILTMKPKTGR